MQFPYPLLGGHVMSDAEKQSIEALLCDPKFIENLRREIEEDNAKAVKCFCGNRCDPPFGNGHECIVCSAKPTAKCLSIIVY